MRLPLGVLAAWAILAITIALTTAVGIVPELQSERALLDDAHQAYIRANRDEIQLRDGAHDETARRRIVASIARMHPPDSRYVGPTAVIRTVDGLDNRFHVTLQRLGQSDGGVREIGVRAVTIEWSGAYRSIVRAVAALSQGPALIRVVGVRLDHNPRMSASIDAVVHVNVYAAIDTL
ncbi:MAG TPA: hypothetical protein VGF98_03880 [Candidatus Tumulicola sp.]|jgi:hypothetical protein